MRYDLIQFKKEDLKKIMLGRFGKLCFADYEVNKKNYITMHHIVPVRDKGKYTIDNIALLSQIAHCIFNEIEKGNWKKAKELNDAFKEFKLWEDKRILQQTHDFMEAERIALGYEIEDRGKLLILKRK